MRRFVQITFSAAVAVIVALTGIEATSHGHAPKADGWHTSGPHGDAEHDGDHKSCSMCRLAHETSSTPAAPTGAAVPLPRLASSHHVGSAPVPAALARDHSPRAPPCLASC